MTILQQLVIRKGDRLPSFVARIVDEDGVPFQLADTDMVTMRLTRIAPLSAAEPLNDASWTTGDRIVATVPDVPGAIRFDWQPGDVSMDPGTFEVTVTVDDGAGVRTTVPTYRQTFLVVRPSVPDPS